MKKVIIILSALFLSFLQLQGIHGEPSISFDGEKENIIIHPENLDLFSSFKNVMPGGNYEQEIIFENKSDEDIDLYFNVDEVVDEFKEFGAYLNIEIYIHGSLVLQSTLANISSFVFPIKIFTLFPEQTDQLIVKLKVDESLPNQFQKEMLINDWHFYLEKTGTVLGVQREKRKKPIFKLPFTGLTNAYMYYLVIILLGFVFWFLGRRRHK